MSTLVTVGNLRNDFQRMATAVEACFEFLPKPIFLQHGHSTFPTIVNHPGVRAFSFCSWVDFERLLDQVDLVISHGGAGTLLEAVEHGFRPAVFSRSRKLGEHIDDHQSQLCESLKRFGAIHIIENEAGLRQYLHHKSDWKGDPISINNDALAKDLHDYIRSIVVQ